MLVRQIREFAKKLQISKLSDFDLVFASRIVAHFSGSKKTELLNTDQRDFLIQIFQQRWDKVADTENDYTFNISGTNSAWIDLAHQLARETHQNHLQILIPVISNTLDPNMLTRLTVCPELRGFFLGDDGTTLHGVCQESCRV